MDDSWDGFSWLNVDDSDRSSVAFMRMSQRSFIVCAVNFTPVRYDDFSIGLPRPGTLKELINSDDVRYGGSGILNRPEIESVDEPFPRPPLLGEDNPAADVLRVVQVHADLTEEAEGGGCEEGEGREEKARAEKDKVTRGHRDRQPSERTGEK